MSSLPQTDLFPVSPSIAVLPELNRQDGLSHLQQFAPHAGAAYTKLRNFDKGEGRHHAVSRLSGHLRRRLITEEEVLRAVTSHHSPQKAEKFILEVFWRSYFRGWLANRPSIWTDFTQYQLPAQHHELYHKAISGQTGIAPFDHWTEELKATSYLHNHARMWFASVWIFTLGLDWQAGAGFFMRHLRDFCPASNTLGWRWAAGLHTLGKHYLASADNIYRFTEGRFDVTGQLNENAPPCPASPHPSPFSSLPQQAVLADKYMLLVTAEDCHIESLPLAHPPACIVSLPAEMGDRCWDSELEAGRDKQLIAADQLAISDAAMRAEQHFACPHVDLSSCSSADEMVRAFTQLAAEHHCTQLITAYPGTGFWQTHLNHLFSAQQGQQLDTGFIVRQIDRLTTPAAQKGFFPFKGNIPKWMNELGV